MGQQIHRFLSAVFGAAEEINGAHRCPTYLFRWSVLSARWFNVYLHHFVSDDWSLDLHDHPRRFVSVGLRGWYVESTPDGDRVFSAPWIRTFPATHIHRISVPSKSCWTLCIVIKPSSREWGFWHEGKFFPWRRYVAGADGIADKMKACE